MFPKEYYPDEYYKGLFSPDSGTPVDPSKPHYFPNRYFKYQYFPKRYFPKIINANDVIYRSCTIIGSSSLTCSSKIIKFGIINIVCNSSVEINNQTITLPVIPDVEYELGGMSGNGGMSLSGFREKEVRITLNFRGKTYSQTKSKKKINLIIKNPAILGRSIKTLKTNFELVGSK